MKEIITALENAWNTGDEVAWAEIFTEDADLVDVLGRVQRGRDVIVEKVGEILRTIYRGSRIEFRHLDDRALADGFVLSHTESVLRVPEGNLAGDIHSTQTIVHRNGKIVAFHNTIQGDFAEFSGQR
ncbi:SgcJ/EcaC family oxidoreductase [Amycolatopsis anabasis]|uniref:SgcJ/EcaC family oxidoreductase n=1 Tax=Amycolatopsis anabasis TaxID=1840409 RepID=UPI001FEB3F81|nr:SgcJ/EcaC family oxidoreductase [Amycolatopsis anabasis]